MATCSRWLPLFIAALGCGHDSGGPGGPILLGQWGAAEPSPALLVGLSVAAELRFSCSAVATHAPLELGPDSSFEFTGRLQASIRYLEPPRARVQGKWRGDIVELSFDILDDNLPSTSHALRREVNPHFDDQPPICPQ
jgi:hypothetical protein